MVLLAVLGIAAAGGVPAQAADAVPRPPVDGLPELEQLAPAILEEAGLPPLDGAVAVETPISLPAVPAQEAAAEPVTAGAVAAPPPVPVSVPPAPVPAVGQPQPDVPPPAAEQTEPANVNVSVRVDSPGNDGAVEQANVATVAEGGPDEPQYQQPPAQYQESETAPVVSDTAAEADAPPASSWKWTWTWDCGGTAPDVPAPPAGVPQSWIWNWTWNCDEREPETDQLTKNSHARYQSDVTQYRPVNVNVSIRINSPGDNGSVRQGNIAVAVAAPTLPVLRVDVPVLASGPAVTAPTVVAALALEPAPAVAAAELAVVAVVGGVTTAETATDDCCALRSPRGVPDAEGERSVPDAPTQRRALIAPERFEPAVVATARLAEAATAAARRARAARAPARTVRPLPSRRPGDPSRDPALVQRSAGFAPLTAQDGRFGRLVLLLLVFGFAIAFADASRSVAAEVRATGEDRDPPPDRPG